MPATSQTSTLKSGGDQGRILQCLRKADPRTEICSSLGLSMGRN